MIVRGFVNYYINKRQRWGGGGNDKTSTPFKDQENKLYKVCPHIPSCVQNIVIPRTALGFGCSKGGGRLMEGPTFLIGRRTDFPAATALGDLRGAGDGEYVDIYGFITFMGSRPG